MAKKKQRSSYLKVNQTVELAQTGITVWGYSTEEEFVCRLEINAAGVGVYTKGGKEICNLPWEKFLARLNQH